MENDSKPPINEQNHTFSTKIGHLSNIYPQKYLYLGYIGERGKSCGMAYLRQGPDTMIFTIFRQFHMVSMIFFAIFLQNLTHHNRKMRFKENPSYYGKMFNPAIGHGEVIISAICSYIA